MEPALNPSHKHLLSDQATEKIQLAIREATQQVIKLTITIGDSTSETPAKKKQAIKNENDQAREKQ